MNHTADLTSLDNLHDIVAPLPVSLWWPLAPGWWILLALSVVIGTWISIKWWKRWRANAYRRAALAELDGIDNLNRIPILLKRTALAAYPRETVASLYGKQWVMFLNSSAPVAHFNGEVGEIVQSLGYTSRVFQESIKNQVINATRKWVLSHRTKIEM
jgi:hypothetical protein